ncbi:TetR/AcrR family transcriptional regulator [Sneathiella sp.]|jgi:AcrR family transcriptional regulator|uniref:TetR/AcrR family transcriptional regulator n=1 Tax=Sneathiella sp. TaxID=1964365 RepID=UPI0039E3A85F
MARSDAVQNRQRIMEAFHRATRTDQPGLPTMSDIVKHSGLGRGTVYRHFPDIGSLAFSFMAVGYEALFDQTRNALRAARSKQETRAALKDHLLRYRAYSKEHLSILIRPECILSDGYILASTSNRHTVRRALRDIAAPKIIEPILLETMSDLIARSAEPANIGVSNITFEMDDTIAETAIDMALTLIDHVVH